MNADKYETQTTRLQKIVFELIGVHRRLCTALLFCEARLLRERLLAAPWFVHYALLRGPMHDGPVQRDDGDIVERDAGGLAQAREPLRLVELRQRALERRVERRVRIARTIERAQARLLVERREHVCEADGRIRR